MENLLTNATRGISTVATRGVSAVNVTNVESALPMGWHERSSQAAISPHNAATLRALMTCHYAAASAWFILSEAQASAVVNVFSTKNGIGIVDLSSGEIAEIVKSKKFVFVIA